MKKLDRFILKAAIAPFIVFSFIALFVLMMQFLWLFLDKLVSKGWSFFLIIEILGFMLFTLIQQALPIGILMASLMVMGNMAERYELSSFKSAGISLLRIMRPLIGLGIMVAIFSYLCANYFIPYTQLKFQKRLSKVQVQQPALGIKAHVFSDLNSFVIHVDQKNDQTGTLQGISIYDHSAKNKAFDVLLAKTGAMTTSSDQEILQMNLYDGVHYQEAANANSNAQSPMIRTKFEKWEKQFDLRKMDPYLLFNGRKEVFNCDQLKKEIDTIQQRQEKKRQQFDQYVQKKISFDPIQTSSPINPSDHKSLLQYLVPKKTNQKKLLKNAEKLIRSIKANAASTQNSIEQLEKSRIRFIYFLQSKYSLAIVCLFFVFVGAPLGAIIKKGGFGYPIIIAILLFTSFFVLETFCRRMAIGLLINPILAAWIPALFIFLLGFIISFLAIQNRNISQLKYLIPIRK